MWEGRCRGLMLACSTVGNDSDPSKAWSWSITQTSELDSVGLPQKQGQRKAGAPLWSAGPDTEWGRLGQLYGKLRRGHEKKERGVFYEVQAFPTTYIHAG